MAHLPCVRPGAICLTNDAQGGVTYCQTFDAENNLVTVETLSSGTYSNKTVSMMVSFVYDGAGN